MRELALADIFHLSPPTLARLDAQDICPRLGRWDFAFAAGLGLCLRAFLAARSFLARCDLTLDGIPTAAPPLK
jgi:hypothetical protein